MLGLVTLGFGISYVTCMNPGAYRHPLLLGAGAVIFLVAQSAWLLGVAYLWPRTSLATDDTADHDDGDAPTEP